MKKLIAKPIYTSFQSSNNVVYNFILEYEVYILYNDGRIKSTGCIIDADCLLVSILK